MPPVVLTERRRAEIKKLFIELGAAWSDPELKEDRDRVVVSGLQPLVDLGGITLRYKRRFNHALATRDSVAMVAAVMGMQDDMLNLVFRGEAPHVQSDKKTLVDRSARWSTNGGIDTFRQGEGNTFGSIQRHREVKLFLQEKLVEMDAAIAVEEAAVSEPPVEEPSDSAGFAP